jgi:hypothetical protein
MFMHAEDVCSACAKLARRNSLNQLPGVCALLSQVHFKKAHRFVKGDFRNLAWP